MILQPERKKERKKKKQKKKRKNLDRLTSARLRVIQEAVSAASRRAHAVLQLSRLRLQAFLRLEAAQTVGGQRPHAGATGGVTVWKQQDSKQVREEEPVSLQSHDRWSASLLGMKFTCPSGEETYGDTFLGNFKAGR